MAHRPLFAKAMKGHVCTDDQRRMTQRFVGGAAWASKEGPWAMPARQVIVLIVTTSPAQRAGLEW